jgi:pimeloyl-ACP methyl ester carboxylesterase
MISYLARFTAIFVIATFGILLSNSPVSAEKDSTVCHQYQLPVRLTTAGPLIYHVFGQLCAQGSLQGKTIQLLIHGATYDHNYWDLPLRPEKYSYVNNAVSNGYATFNIDRIGIGLSDHPTSNLVTLESNAFVIHQIIQNLQTGKLINAYFPKIVLVGHSLGSVIALQEQATYKDANGLILSGFSHSLNLNGINLFSSSSYLATLDPKFATGSFPGTYLTTRPETRGSLFYNAANTDPKVVSEDEILKQTITDSELSTAPSALDPRISQSINIPVLIVNGEQDKLFCGSAVSCQNSDTLKQGELANFSDQACLKTFVLPEAGHSINLHLNANIWFKLANKWISAHVTNSLESFPKKTCSIM